MKIKDEFEEKYEKEPNTNTSLKNVIYDNLSNINISGLQGKHGSQIALMMFLNHQGNVEGDIRDSVFSLLLKEPFKISLSTKSPTESPYVTLRNDFISKTKKYTSAGIMTNYDNVDGDNLSDNKELYKAYSPINITDDFSIKMYSGTNHPNFNLNGRLYFDRALFKPLDLYNKDTYLSNVNYIANFITRLINCVLPSNSTNGAIDFGWIKDRLGTLAGGYAIENTTIGKLFAGTVLFSKSNFNFDTLSSNFNSINEGTYGTNIVSFCVPYLFGNIAAFGNESNNKAKDGEKTIDLGRMFNMKCFVKHFDFKLSKDNFVLKTIDTNGKETITKYPSYIDVNITLESVEIPSVRTWITDWVTLQN